MRPAALQRDDQATVRIIKISYTVMLIRELEALGAQTTCEAEL